ncbi:MAG: hypothetical protein ACK5VI_10200, partial [Opitutia bacterium]
MPAKLPSVICHKRSGRAFIWITTPDGRRRQRYLGPYGSPEAEQNRKLEIERWRAAWAAHERPAPTYNGNTATVAVVVAKYLEDAEVYY